MIRDFKAQIFCREMNLSKREIDTSDQIWIDRIDAFFRKTSLLPPDGDPTEYAKAFEAVYPQPRHRRQYIDDAISKGSLCFGHKVLGSLIASGQTDCVFTTNFDPLIEEAAHLANSILPIDNQNRPTVAAIDSADRAMRCLNESDWPLVAKLHGDYQSVSIKNTGSELEEQDARMRHVLVEVGKRLGMVFVGYSGRDASVMEVLNAVLDAPSPFPNGLYWLTSSASRLLPAVSEFLSRALATGVDVAIVECATFDELAAQIIKATDLPQRLFDWVMEGRPTPRLVPVQLPTAEARSFPILRYSSLLIESMPGKARRIKLTQHATSPVVREMLKEKGVRATVASKGREIAVFGKDRDIIEALAPLGATLDGEVELDLTTDSWAMGLVYDALVRALTRHLPLIPLYKRFGHSVVIASPRKGEDLEEGRRNASLLYNLRQAYKSDLTGTVPGLGLPFQEGLFLKLEQANGRWWLGFEPYTFVQTPHRHEGNLASVEEANTDPMSVRRDRGGDPAGDWRRERWAQRYNRNWASIIDAWAQLLTKANGNTKRAFGLPDGTGIDAVFTISSMTGWSRPGHHDVYFDRTT